MAYNPNDLMPAEAAGLGSGLRVFPSSIQPKTFKLGSGTLAKLCPVQFEAASGQFIPWPGGATNMIHTITAGATVATDGTFDLTIHKGGVPITIADIDHDVAVAALETLIADALGIIENTDVTVTEAGGGLDANDGTCIITWSGAMAEQYILMTADFSGLTGTTHVLSETAVGVGSRIDGFVWPDAVVLDADEEVLGQVMLGGRIHAGDLVASPDAPVAAVLAQCRSGQVRDSGFIIEGLPDFH